MSYNKKFVQPLRKHSPWSETMPQSYLDTLLSGLDRDRFVYLLQTNAIANTAYHLAVSERWGQARFLEQLVVELAKQNHHLILSAVERSASTVPMLCLNRCKVCGATPNPFSNEHSP